MATHLFQWGASRGMFGISLMHGQFGLAHLASAQRVVFALEHAGVGRGVGVTIPAGCQSPLSHGRTWLESCSL